MSRLERDEEFEAYLRRRSVLRDRELPPQGLEPPEDLDKIVLKTAREAIQTPRPLPLYRAPRWALPVGLAATLLLSLSIVLNIGLKQYRRQEAPSQASVPVVAPAASRPATPAAAAPMPAEVAEAGSRAKGLREPQIPQDMSQADAYAAAPARQPAQPDPRLWLKRIEALRTEGKITVADAEWRRFRATYPDFPVPASPAPPSGTAK